MSKSIFAVLVTLLAGCASNGQWRTLSIDGSTEAAFGRSLSRLNDELSYSRNQMFAMALADIARTAAQTTGLLEDGSPAYTAEDYRHDLDGLTYDGVIDLADQRGPSISRLYNSRAWAQSQRETNRLLTAMHDDRGPTPPPITYSFDSNGNIEWHSQ